jgi:lysozyme family protein
MAASSYDMALARVLKHEGGYTNHPSDPGGPTNFGITLHDYRRYIKSNGTASDVREMKLADAAKIYRARYWDALRCDQLPAGLDYAVFDYGVNSGTGRAARVMARLLGQAPTGVMTEAAMAGIRSASPQVLIARLCDERLAFLKSLRTWPVFGAGWGRRVSDVRRDALAMAKGAAGRAPAPAPAQANGKGEVPAPKAARAGTAAASVIAGGGAAQIAHASGLSPSLCLAMLAGGVALAAASWLGWNWWRSRKQEAPAVRFDAVAPRTGSWKS